MWCGIECVLAPHCVLHHRAFCPTSSKYQRRNWQVEMSAVDLVLESVDLTAHTDYN